jgi:hypothetical protein
MVTIDFLPVLKFTSKTADNIKRDCLFTPFAAENPPERYTQKAVQFAEMDKRSSLCSLCVI